MSRKCVNNPNNFCYVCGKITFASQKCTITPTIKTSSSYRLYFGFDIGEQEKSWAPHVCCVSCASDLRNWLSGKLKCMPFTVPMKWREQSDHFNDCYFCKISPIGKCSEINKKNTFIYL